jgi:hypothetical protein
MSEFIPLTCAVPECKRPYSGKGLCGFHIKRVRLPRIKALAKGPRRNVKRDENKDKEWRLKNKEKIRANGAAWRRRNPLRAVMINAEQRGLPVSITNEQLVKLRKRPCHYCGGSLPPAGSGLDRLDNTKGYHLDNVVPCCTTCNLMRGDRLTPEETKVAAQAIKQYRLLNGSLKIIKG